VFCCAKSRADGTADEEGEEEPGEKLDAGEIPTGSSERVFDVFDRIGRGHRGLVVRVFGDFPYHGITMSCKLMAKRFIEHFILSCTVHVQYQFCYLC